MSTKKALTPFERIQKVLIHFNMNKPFYGVLSSHLNWKLDSREENQIETACTDGVSVLFGEEFVKKCSDEQLLTVALHEINHVAKKHIGRRHRRDFQQWNIATDHQINLELKDENCLFGDMEFEICIDPQYKGLIEETIYDRLPERTKCFKGPGGFTETVGELTDGFFRDQGSYANYENKLDRVLEKAVMISKAAGKCPGWASDYVFQNRKSRVNWRSKLRRFMSQMLARGGDLTWANPVKRLIWSGMILPSDNWVPSCDIVCAFDTSGSMSKPAVDACVSELNAIFQEFNGQVFAHNIWFNAHVYHSEKIQQFKAPTSIEGGGTSFQAVFDHIQKEKIKPRCLIMLTDMYDSFPEKPNFPVLWVATTEIEAPYGQTIKVEVES